MDRVDARIVPTLATGVDPLPPGAGTPLKGRAEQYAPHYLRLDSDSNDARIAYMNSLVSGIYRLAAPEISVSRDETDRRLKVKLREMCRKYGKNKVETTIRDHRTHPKDQDLKVRVLLMLPRE